MVQDLILRADATTSMGTGHLMRCLALAQAWLASGGTATFVTCCRNTSLRKRIEDSGARIVDIEAPYPDPRDVETTRAVLNQHPNAALVVDGYEFDGAFQERLRPHAAPLVVIDDFVHADEYHAHIILNQNLGAERLVYPCSRDTRLLLGPKFALLRNEFVRRREWQREVPVVAWRVLVTLGGSDPDNVTLKVVRALQRLDDPKLEALIVVGAGNPHRSELEAATSRAGSRVRLVHAVADMAERMAWADVAVSAGGTTCYELAFMGLPNAIIVLADNQAASAHALDEAGVSMLLGEARNVDEARLADGLTALIHDPGRRRAMGLHGRALVDGRGSERVIAAILGEKVPD